MSNQYQNLNNALYDQAVGQQVVGQQAFAGSVGSSHNAGFAPVVLALYD